MQKVWAWPSETFEVQGRGWFRASLGQKLGHTPQFAKSVFRGSSLSFQNLKTPVASSSSPKRGPPVAGGGSGGCTFCLALLSALKASVCPPPQQGHPPSPNCASVPSGLIGTRWSRCPVSSSICAFPEVSGSCHLGGVFRDSVACAVSKYPVHSDRQTAAPGHCSREQEV